MPLPAVPGIAWVIVAVGAALSILLFVHLFGEAVQWVVLVVGVIGGLIGIAALVEILRDLTRRKGP
jgi:hypothetical protein